MKTKSFGVAETKYSAENTLCHIARTESGMNVVSICGIRLSWMLGDFETTPTGWNLCIKCGKQMKPVSWKQACQWNWHRRSNVKLVWVNGRTGRRAFLTDRIPSLLLIIWKYRQRGIPMINPVMTYKGREIEIPAVIEKRGLRMIGKSQKEVHHG